jgi:hydroxypyruvate reductase
LAAPLRNVARDLSDAFVTDLDLAALVRQALEPLDLPGRVNVIAFGKAAPEMMRAATAVLDDRRGDRLVICDEAGASVAEAEEVCVGEHPVPGLRSERAAAAAMKFVRDQHESVLFLVSGGASSLCSSPASPVTSDDVVTLWFSALRAGIDIGQLNLVRRAISNVASGRLLCLNPSNWSASLIMVDNVIDGAPGVGSGPTYSRPLDVEQVVEVLSLLDLTGSALADRILQAASRPMPTPSPAHRNVTLVAPSDALAATRVRARRSGYRVVELGADLVSDVDALAHRFAQAMESAPSRTCVLGAGEARVAVHGGGRGGRCQEMAIRVGLSMRQTDRAMAFVARATDGCDHLSDVGGAVVDSAIAIALQHDRSSVLHELEQSESYEPLRRHDGLIPGERTGWNLCDLYVGVVD